jgi:RimJ/RimL family protein N-acetyltransferase
VDIDEHQKWFTKVLGDANAHRIWLIENEKREALGSIRVDRLSESEGQISIYLEKKYTGQGLGVRALDLAKVEALSEMQLDQLIALVRTENQASISAFKKAGFALSVAPKSPKPGHLEFYFPPER